MTASTSQQKEGSEGRKRLDGGMREERPEEAARSETEFPARHSDVGGFIYRLKCDGRSRVETRAFQVELGTELRVLECATGMPLGRHFDTFARTEAAAFFSSPLVAVLDLSRSSTSNQPAYAGALFQESNAETYLCHLAAPPCELLSSKNFPPFGMKGPRTNRGGQTGTSELVIHSEFPQDITITLPNCYFFTCSMSKPLEWLGD